MLTQSSQIPGHSGKRPAWNREAATDLLRQYQALQRRGWSQRQFASDEEVPRTTLQHWITRAEQIGADPEVVAFFESPAGLAFLHRLVTAAHFVMNNMGNCGIRLVALMLGLAGVGPFVGLSYGTHQKMATDMLEGILQYEKEQRPQLAAQMPHKQITVCEDETFPAGGMCLVAVEPVSNFIVLEEYSDRRDAETWNTKLQEAIRDLKVDIVQSTSDEARALLRHAKDQGAHHSPDLFHVLHEVNAALVLPLQRRTALAEEAHGKALTKLNEEKRRHAAYEEGPRRRGRRPDFEKHIAAAHQNLEQAADSLRVAHGWQDRRENAMAGISWSYHPYELDTGLRRESPQAQSELDAQFEQLGRIVQEAGLSEKTREGVDKAARVAPQMVATIAFFHNAVQRRIEARELPDEQEALLYDILVPAAYIANAANRAATAETAARLRAVANTIRAALDDPGSLWVRMTPDHQGELTALAQECADLFQRSSSCTEGRNGRLALWEHALRHVSPEKLRALTITQNYAATRSDGTTAAERFFGVRPADLFEYLVDKMAPPPRPRRRGIRTEKRRPVGGAF